ncbi:uncharacterized protein FIBRA_02189 [Fibroporia radiculosa]|uniref:Major facilitator superfamily (MFS) profile domain-containing protein n=1 Tax=Fibroporia radiculosa TaxID=599839 RepID=J4I8X3_9APHY|nr:uncharacterized protein FIBRA_02189 [Fibroporia radiculosa]CCM00161.1 predicted protein [Fibroporia radiculosa]
MLPMIFFPPCVVAYGWICEEHVHIAAVCVILFFSGFFMISIYSSTLAYIVDANVGRSSSAVACNSCFRGILAFIAAEVAVPLQDSIGDGGLYSMWAGLMLVSEVLLLLVWWKGAQWREKALAQEATRLWFSSNEFRATPGLWAIMTSCFNLANDEDRLVQRLIQYEVVAQESINENRKLGTTEALQPHYDQALAWFESTALYRMPDIADRAAKDEWFRQCDEICFGRKNSQKDHCATVLVAVGALQVLRFQDLKEYGAIHGPSHVQRIMRRTAEEVHRRVVSPQERAAAQHAYQTSPFTSDSTSSHDLVGLKLACPTSHGGNVEITIADCATTAISKDPYYILSYSTGETKCVSKEELDVILTKSAIILDD